MKRYSVSASDAELAEESPSDAELAEESPELTIYDFVRIISCLAELSHLNQVIVF